MKYKVLVKHFLNPELPGTLVSRISNLEISNNQNGLFEKRKEFCRKIYCV